MATLSSLGIGSGLDANSIVSQLVALEKQPLKALQSKATIVQGQISAFGQIQSQISAFTDVATRIADPTTWFGRNASSSNTGAATIKADKTASAGSFSLDVDALAKPQSIASAGVAPGTPPGAGTLTLQLGTWNAGVFTAGAAAGVNVTVAATDTIADIATQINSAHLGVVASVFNDGVNDHLTLQSQNTGAAAGFQVQSADAALQGMVFDPQNKPGVGMAAVTQPVQYGQDAKARINGLAVTSATNTLTGNMTGVTITLGATTTTGYGTPGEVKSPVTMSIGVDVTPAVKNVQDFVTAYNTLDKTLTDLTKYDASTQTGAAFQGDATVVGMQNLLRNILGSSTQGSTYQRLSEVGIEKQLDGSLTINTAKLSTAANNGTALQDLFTINNGNASTNGFALKFRDLGQGILANGGSVANKAKVLQAALVRNTADQTKVNDHASLVETRLKAQYSALDGKMAALNSLSTYVAQQVTAWNNTKG